MNIDVKLHIFNPEHDIALAYNHDYMIAPHAAQEMRMNLGYIPSLWADDGDVVLVDDVRYAVKSASALKKYAADVLFVGIDDLNDFAFDEICPWGWDRVLRTRLLEAGVAKELLPTDEQVDSIRDLSSRVQTSAFHDFMKQCSVKGICGDSFLCDNIEEVKYYMSEYGKIVIKAPWSSSGRGIRYSVDSDDICQSTLGWIKNVVSRQGGVMVEPYYKKVEDFAMEFYSDGIGNIEYTGLSLFKTCNGAYAGNILATEDDKLEMLYAKIPEELIFVIKQMAIQYFSSLLRHRYKGPFGIDMMIVSTEGEGFLVNPCVEINLRNTMGHLAVALSPTEFEPRKLMRIVHNVNYQLKISDMENNFVKVL